VPWGSSKPFVHPGLPAGSQQQPPTDALPSAAAQLGVPQEPEEALPPGVEPLVLWEPGDAATAAGADAGAEQSVVVDPMLTRWLRAHQREGVQFLFDCVCGLRFSGGNGKTAARGGAAGRNCQYCPVPVAHIAVDIAVLVKQQCSELIGRAGAWATSRLRASCSQAHLLQQHLVVDILLSWGMP